MSTAYLSLADDLPADRRAMVVAPRDASWRAASIALLSVRFIQGFIYWGGGSRRFIYAPAKLDPHASHWMANKFQSAMPGALLGTDHVIGYMLQHFWLLYPGVILFSAAELVAGLFLIAGLFTRAAALTTVGFSIILMLMFGWQGATCIDEWTMAACNVAMGATLALAGGGTYSLDGFLLSRKPALAARRWFRWTTGALPLPLGGPAFRNLGLAVLAVTAVFNVATYDHYRGSVYSAFHPGPVSPAEHHFKVNDAKVGQDGTLRFHAYLDGGSPDVDAHIMQIAVLDAAGGMVRRWDTAALSGLPAPAIVNDFAYNKFEVAPYGLSAGMGAMATITLTGISAIGPGATLVLTSITGKLFKAPVS